MTQGRKKKPTKLHLLHGNPGKRKISKDEPQFNPEIPDCPEHLNEEAKKEWQRITPQLYQVGLLAKINRTALAAYCQAYSRWVEAEGLIKKHGVLVKSPSGFPMQHPALAIANKAWEQMMKALVEFGMTPASQARVKIQPKEKEDPLEKFLSAKK